MYGLHRLPPTIAEAMIVFDFIELWVHLAELLADARDKGTDVGAETFGTTTGAETLSAHHVVESGIRPIAPRLSHQDFHDSNLSHSQFNPVSPPESPVVAQLE